MKRRIGLVTIFCLALFSGGLAAPAENVPPAADDALKIECVGSHADDDKGRQVLDVVRQMLKSVEMKDFKEFGNNLDNDASMFDEKSKELITGKDNIIEKIKEKVDQKASKRLTKFQIQDAYARVVNDTATVTYRAVKEYAGEHPIKMESHCSNVFALKDGKWKLIHYKTAWRKV